MRPTRPLRAAPRSRRASPAAGTASGLRKHSSSPVAASAPRLQAAAKPRLAPVSIRLAPGASSRTACDGAVGGGVVDDDQLVCRSRAPSTSAGSVRATASRLSWVTTTTESELRVCGRAPSASPRCRGRSRRSRPARRAACRSRPTCLLDVPPALGPPADVRGDDHVVVVGAEHLLRRGLEVVEVAQQAGEEVAEALGPEEGPAPWQRPTGLISPSGATTRSRPRCRPRPTRPRPPESRRRCPAPSAHLHSTPEPTHNPHAASIRSRRPDSNRRPLHYE